MYTASKACDNNDKYHGSKILVSFLGTSVQTFSGIFLSITVAIESDKRKQGIQWFSSEAGNHTEKHIWLNTAFGRQIKLASLLIYQLLSETGRWRQRSS